MHPRPQHLNLLYSLSYLSLAVALNLLANGCSQQVKPISPASTGDENHQPYTFYAPSPADGAAEIGDKVTFEWQFDNPDYIPMHYEIYMGTDSLIYISDATTATSYTPAWGMQSRAKEMLVQIYEMQRAYKARYNDYCCNGTCAMYLNNPFEENLGINIDSTDMYIYVMTAGANTFWCVAHNWENPSNPHSDTWDINHNAEIRHTNFQYSLEFEPGMEYSWQIVAIDSNQNRIESPIWRFTTTHNTLYPGNATMTLRFPFPVDNFSGIPFTDYLCWYGGSLSDSLSFDLYLGLGNNLRLQRTDLNVSMYAPDWYLQNRLKERLNWIARILNDLKNTYGCYRGNGSIRLPTGYGQFDSTCLNMCDFSQEDKYTYIVAATCSTFTVTATVNLDCDPEIDTWTLDQTGLISCTANDANIPYRAHQRYSWKIVEHDSHGNTIEGPVWHFAANPSIGTAH